MGGEGTVNPCRWMAWSVALVLSLGLCSAVGAAEHPPGRHASFTLADAVARALEEGPAARIARLEAGQAEDALAEARSAYLPRASITSQAGYSNRFDEKLRTVDASGRERRYNLANIDSDRGWFSFYIEQLLFDLRTWRGVERAELSAEAGRVAEAEKREAISLEVIRHYAEALRVDDLGELDAERVAEAERLDVRAESLLAAGRIVASEREEASLALAALRMHARGQVGVQAEARRTLAMATGVERHESLELVPASLPAVEHSNADFDADEELEGAPELRLLSLRKRMEEVSVAAARAERYPTVGLRAGYSNYGARRYDNFRDELSVGVDVRMPLFDGFKASHSIAGALKGAEIARLRYETMLEQKRARVRELSRQLDEGTERPALAARRATIARERVRLAEVRLQNGRGTLSEVLTARESWGRDARAAIDARYDAIVLWATLQREVGRLSAAIVGAGDAAMAKHEGDS